MKTVSITKNQTSYYEAQKGDTTYVLEKGVSISSSEFAGLVAFSAVHDRDIVIKGSIDTMNGYGVHIGSNEHDGGGNDDLYMIDDPLIKLGEQMNAGTDTVRSSITWKLGANFENLVLSGKASITGTGSDDANRITGNAGQNTLFGLGGIDLINGGKGDDTLNGGAAADHFIFTTGTGHDTIADFQDGMDLIDITAIKGIKDFGQIAEAMVQNGVNVDIDLGNGDVLTVANTTLAKLTAIDFAY